jgi:hypothetical protein
VSRRRRYRFSITLTAALERSSTDMVGGHFWLDVDNSSGRLDRRQLLLSAHDFQAALFDVVDWLG